MKIKSLLSCRHASNASRPVATALATFGIIGVGASELIGYPYWCLEKGYAKYTGQGKRDDAWYVRANGWIRVMKYDAYFSMIIYTIATLAFFVMGVAVMYRQGLDPEGMRMVSTLAEQYVPVFGEYATGRKVRPRYQIDQLANSRLGMLSCSLPKDLSWYIHRRPLMSP